MNARPSVLPHIRLATAAALSLCCVAVPSRAQSPLDRMFERFQQQRMQLVESQAGVDEHHELAATFADKLEAFLPLAKGDDVHNARLMLIDHRLNLGQRDRAERLLQGFDGKTTPALVLATAAEFAAHLGLDGERDRWIEAALAKREPFETRMLLGMHLMTRLAEVEKGEGVFREALAAAGDDEQRARVRWYHAMALREREDLPASAHEEALRSLADELSDTHFGSIAADRLRARALAPGKPAIPFRATDVNGAAVEMTPPNDAVVLLHFWASWCGPCERAAPHLRRWHGRFADRGLAMISVSMDDQVEAAVEVAEQHGAEWPLVCDGKGPQTELALRYGVDGPPRLFLIDRQGKIISLRQYPIDDASAAELEKLIEAALAGES